MSRSGPLRRDLLHQARLIGAYLLRIDTPWSTTPAELALAATELREWWSESFAQNSEPRVVVVDGGTATAQVVADFLAQGREPLGYLRGDGDGDELAEPLVIPLFANARSARDVLRIALDVVEWVEARDAAVGVGTRDTTLLQSGLTDLVVNLAGVAFSLAGLDGASHTVAGAQILEAAYATARGIRTARQDAPGPTLLSEEFLAQQVAALVGALACMAPVVVYIERLDRRSVGWEMLASATAARRPVCFVVLADEPDAVDLPDGCGRYVSTRAWPEMSLSDRAVAQRLTSVPLGALGGANNTVDRSFGESESAAVLAGAMRVARYADGANIAPVLVTSEEFDALSVEPGENLPGVQIQQVCGDIFEVRANWTVAQLDEAEIGWLAVLGQSCPPDLDLTAAATLRLENLARYACRCVVAAADAFDARVFADLALDVLAELDTRKRYESMRRASGRAIAKLRGMSRGPLDRMVLARCSVNGGPGSASTDPLGRFLEATDLLAVGHGNIDEMVAAADHVAGLLPEVIDSIDPSFALSAAIEVVRVLVSAGEGYRAEAVVGRFHDYGFFLGEDADADLMRALSERAGAFEASQRRLRCVEREIGVYANTPSLALQLAKCRKEAADLCTHLGRFESALAFAEAALGATVGLLGQHHPDSVQSAAMLEVALNNSGRREDALNLARNWYPIAEISGNRRSKATGLLMRYQAEAGHQPDDVFDLPETRAAAVRVLREMTLELGEEHPTTRLARFYYARRLAPRPSPDDGLDQLRTIFDEVRATEEPVTWLKAHLALALWQIDPATRPRSAALRAFVENVRSEFGPEHPTAVALTEMDSAHTARPA